MFTWGLGCVASATTPQPTDQRVSRRTHFGLVDWMAARTSCAVSIKTGESTLAPSGMTIQGNTIVQDRFLQSEIGRSALL